VNDDLDIATFLEVIFNEYPLPDPNSCRLAVFPFERVPKPIGSTTNAELVTRPGFLEKKS
jgi:hypothetical protein